MVRTSVLGACFAILAASAFLLAGCPGAGGDGAPTGDASAGGAEARSETPIPPYEYPIPLDLPAIVGPAAGDAPVARHALGPDGLWVGGRRIAALEDGELVGPAPGDDPWGGWALEGVDGGGAPPLLAVDRSTSVGALRRAAASLAGPGGRVELLGRVAGQDASEVLGSLSLGLSSSEEPPALRVRVRATGIDVLPGGIRVPPPGGHTAVIAPLANGVSAEPPADPDDLIETLGLDRLPDLVRREASEETVSVALALDDDLPVAALVAVASALTWTGEGDPWLEVSLAMDHRPCLDAPAGMACIRGGPTAVGHADARDNPPREVEISTFYLDRSEVTVGAFRGCVEADFCDPPDHLPDAGDGDDDRAVKDVAYRDAYRYCAWSGKRLPSEWEWEKAARVVPSELSGLDGSVAEWTTSWTEPDWGDCGPSCEGTDPQGWCDGAHPCKGVRKKVVRGGSKREEFDDEALTHRRRQSRRAHSDTGLRCAASSPRLTTFPPRQIATPYAPLGLPDPPSDEDRAVAAGVAQDDIGDKPVCGEEVRVSWPEHLSRGGRSELTCRDPFSYVTTNERRTPTFRRYIENIGGGYLGVGSDQNYDFIALARSRWAWVLDYDPNVVRLHHVLRALILASETPEEFVDRFGEEQEDASLALLEETYADHPQKEKFKRFYVGRREKLLKHYRGSLEPREEDPEYGWLSHAGHYAYIRTLYQQGRLVPVAGDMLGTVTMRAVGDAAEGIGIPIRIYYATNAPTAWGGAITDDYRANVRALPFDDQSVVLETFSRMEAFHQKGYWHYAVMDGHLHQQRIGLAGYTKVEQLFWDRIPADDPDVTVCGLPGG